MTLNGVDLSVFKIELACPGIKGQWDAPARIEKTHNNWLDQDCLEPYIRDDEIFFGGRTLIVSGFIPFSERTYYELNDFLDTFVGEVELVTDLRTYMVRVQSFKVIRLCPNDLAEIEIRFYEARPEIWGELPEIASGGLGINGYSWHDIGVRFLKDEDSASRGESKTLESSIFGVDLRRSRKRTSLGINIKLLAVGDIDVITGRLASILMSPGKKTLFLKDGLYREVFLESGFTTTLLKETSTVSYAEISMILTEIRTIENLVVFSDDSVILGNAHDEEIGFFIN